MFFKKKKVINPLASGFSQTPISNLECLLEVATEFRTKIRLRGSSSGKIVPVS